MGGNTVCHVLVSVLVVLGMFFVLCCCWVTKIPNGYTRGNTFQSLGNNNSG